MIDGNTSMKIDGVAFSLSLGGGTIAFTTQDLLQLIGLTIGLLGLAMGIVRWLQGKKVLHESVKSRLEQARRNDAMEEANRIARERLELDKQQASK